MPGGHLELMRSNIPMSRSSIIVGASQGQGPWHYCMCKSGARPLKGQPFDLKLYEPGESKFCTHDKQSQRLNE